MLEFKLGCYNNSLIRTPNWTIYIYVLIVSIRSTQWCPIGILTMLSRPVRPDCPANSVFADFGCQHMPPCFLVKLAYQETSLKAQNCTETMRITRVNHVLLLRAILYIGHINWFCPISLLHSCSMPLMHLVWVNQVWVHMTSAVNSWNTG